MNLSEFLSGVLSERNLSQRTFAKLANVSFKTINRIIHGETVDPDSLNKIADYLNEPRVKLYRLAGYLQEQSINEEIEEAIDILSKLPLKSRRKVVALLRKVAEIELEDQEM